MAKRIWPPQLQAHITITLMGFAMMIICFILGLLECAFIYILGLTATKLAKNAQKQIEEVEDNKHSWPPCAMIVPVAGTHPFMENALRSLCEQDYPDYTIVFVSAENDEAATTLINKLKGDYPWLVHAVAPLSENCCQKNANLLAGIAAVSERVEIFSFCDSTHLARHDFLRCLIQPLARHEAAFATGYHQVLPQDLRPVTLAYCLTVCFMRLLQGISAFTQPWGGAMAMTREAFQRYNVAALWQKTVVDDCSLAALLREQGVHPVLCPGALLVTIAQKHSFKIWEAWLERQILFLKFYIYGQWLALGAMCLFMLVPALWAFFSVLGGLFNFGSASAAFLSLFWFLILAWCLLGWKAALPENIPFWRWLPAFFMALSLFAKVFLSTIRQKNLFWHGVAYHVSSDGKVTSITRKTIN